MKTESEKNEPDQRYLRVSRSGRVVKRAPQFKGPQLPLSKAALCGRWSVAAKENLLLCLNKYESVQYCPLTVFRSIRNRPRSQVLEFMQRLRKKAAAHSEEIRKKQPPILTWFQVADELSWLKDSEDLYTTIVPLLSIMRVDANSRQNRNPVLMFSKLYKYLKALHKDEVLPELTPAESVVLLDCFQHLADTLRASDTEAQTEFMLSQYKEYFQLLYFAEERIIDRRFHPGKELRDRPRDTSRKPAWRAGSSSENRKSRTSSAKRNNSQKPLMKAELRPKKKGKKKMATEDAPPGNSPGLQDRQGKSSRQMEQTEREAGQKSSQDGQGQGSEQLEWTEQNAGQRLPLADQCAASPSKVRMRSTADGDQDSLTNDDGTVRKASEHDTGRSAVVGSGGAAGLRREASDLASSRSQRDLKGLDPEDPDFLSKFAGMFSLGSLNPFEIPAELMGFRPKVDGSESDHDSDDGDENGDEEENGDNDNCPPPQRPSRTVSDGRNTPSTSASVGLAHTVVGVAPPTRV